MAEIVDTMPNVAGRTPLDSYPWDQWLDGNLWHLRRGEDYTVATTSLRTYIYKMTSTRGLVIDTVRDPDGDGITIQAFAPEQDPA